MPRLKDFLNVAELKKVPHDGSCFLRCVAAFENVSMDTVAHKFMAAVTEYSKKPARDWLAAFRPQYEIHSSIR